MGSNMAEQHPVGFQWVMEARERGAQVIHVDPRFTRTSAVATQHVAIRPGTDIAFLGGLINHVLQNDLWFEEYVKTFTNAKVIVHDDYAGTDDNDGLFSGWDPERGIYDIETWQYKGFDVPGMDQHREGGVGSAEVHGAGGAPLSGAHPPEQDETLQNPRCVFQLLRRHFERYTPETVAGICGCRPEDVVRIAETLAANSGRERTSAFCYAVGWTQHTVGVQIIRACAILQLLLGNIGRPGGGIMALRGHASIQGSTDIPTLYNLLPGYLPMPHAGADENLAEYVEKNSAPGGWWGHADNYMVSLLKAWWGPNAAAANDFNYEFLPKIDGDASIYQTTRWMHDGTVKGLVVAGENPAVGSANGKAHRTGMAKLDWLVVRDVMETETAAFWYDSPEVEAGELSPQQIGTEVFFLPASTHTEKDGSFTNTQRLLQWHYRAVDPKHDCRSELWFYFHLGKILRRKLLGSLDPRDKPVQQLTWEYPTSGEIEEPSAEAVLKEINGYYIVNGDAVPSYEELQSDGSTACGCWIYCGVYAHEENQAARRKPHWEQDITALQWGWAWPDNRRIIYNRASADAEGKPWSERKKYLWWNSAESKWDSTGDRADTDDTKSPSYVPPPDAEAEEAIGGDKAFGLQSDGYGWLFAPTGVEDGPLPTHYEPHESPTDNPLYHQRANPRRQQFADHEFGDTNPYQPVDGEPGSDLYPYSLTTYRVTEHHCAGGFSRTIPYLSELQPAMFVEVHPDLATERGLVNGGWATIISARAAIEARVLVTDRMRPMTVDGRRVHQVGLPYHWGTRGLTTGGSANDLTSIVLDPNVHIQEVKALSCDIRPGRRPRGADLPAFIARVREEALSRRRPAQRVEPEETVNTEPPGRRGDQDQAGKGAEDA
jgi:formate dehydrogenase major subunit